MPQASQQTLDKFLELAKEDFQDHGIYQQVASNILHENFQLNTGGWYAKKDPLYAPTDKEYAALRYLVEEWDYGFDAG